ncbi:N-acetyl-gamma-glutamyl-phosphate reductase, common form [Halobacteroides halobius DSM 5150]|uniref:N-acetyl-gamma-glutamyl-phosphate reductase n=1 Tax=Halobacteroides halobius (strain ATCC 35273 / DSM 5150 / MD-1) TaxID=748449 RepID=L0K6S5_HALHC|nr:N-acetyl-gamma-glutamyl-phosphate reductase [Halobacteroides halobius]AGB40726.1 N-acetyl-gamma-glutamyl-phosphate reductase, common form [Halobacteroides halobius DSM 5150]
MKVSVIGATGYTGVELVRLLNEHPNIELSLLTSNSFAENKIDEIYPHLKEEVEIICHKLDIEQIVTNSEVVFTALPHGVSMDIVPKLVNRGVKVIDLSGDYRYQTLATYEEYYQKHASPQLLSQGVYGLPELNRKKIKDSNLVANPGCYPTVSLLALAPLLKTGLIDPQSIIIDAKSGATGAGRKLSLGTHFCEVNNNFKAYKVGQHRHRSEIEEKLSIWSKQEVKLNFTPHLLPVKRGILATIYADLTDDIAELELFKQYQNHYQEELFVRVREDNMPELKYVAGSNYCDISLKVTDGNKVIIVATIDNLIKGSAGQAVQNLNLLAGWEEDLGLKKVGLYL